jgi:ribosomal protein S18 acetylase RimI-like enzyme
MAERVVTPQDRDRLSAVLARAFADDPVTRWVYGPIADGARRERQLRRERRFFAWLLDRVTEHEVSWTTESGQGAAIWALPGRWRETPRQALELCAIAAPAVGLRAARVLRGLAAVERSHPDRPHLYLATLGVDPESQGAGVGSALLRRGLELCDREGVPAYLETATERNIDFYARHGFRVTGQVHLPQGPPVWLMWREPG